MNDIGWLILVALVANYLVATVAGILNLRAMQSELPNEFVGVFDDDAYQASQRYTKAKTRLGLVSDTVSLVLLITFWLIGGFQALDVFARGLGWSDTMTGIAFISALVAAQSVIGLPFAVYATFVLEANFGFNRTSVSTFVVDRLKGLVLAAAIGLPLLGAILFFFETAGGMAWFYCWMLVVLFTVVMQFIAPTVIMPLFNRFEPLGEGSLRERIFAMAKTAKFPINNILIMDGSKRSSKSNAFFTGIGSQKRIALYDTLVEQHTEEELVAVLAHEIGHYKKKHILQGMLMSIIHTGILFYLLSLALTYQDLFDAFFVDKMSIYAGLVFFGLLLTPLELVLSLAMNALTRRNEFQADEYAANITGTSDTLVSALRKLSRSNLSNLTPHPMFVRLYYSHPPVVERIRTLQNL